MADEGTAAPSAPTTTTTADTSAPAAPAAAAPPDVKKPASFKAALFAAEKAESSPADPGDASTASAAATVLPTDAGSPANRGPVPYDRFAEVNTRMQAAEKRAKEHEAYAWAKGLDQRIVHETVQWRADALSNPEKFIRDVYTSATPEMQATFRKEFGGAPAPVSTQEPPPDLQTDTGQPVYSAKQLAAWQDWRDAKSQAAFDQRLAPIQAELNRGKDERAKVESKAKAQAFASTTMKDAADWPGFTAHVTAIAEEYAKHPIGKTEADESLALHRAYMTVYRRDVLPTIDKTAEDRAIATMQTKAAAGSAHPGRATTAPNPNRPKSLGESLRREADKAGWR